MLRKFHTANACIRRGIRSIKTSTGWLSGTAHRWITLTGSAVTLVGLVTFAATASLPLAWLTIAALLLLAVSLAWTARDEYAARVAWEGLDGRIAELERAIDDGHAIGRMSATPRVP
jgi:hypothetical protein